MSTFTNLSKSGSLYLTAEKELTSVDLRDLTSSAVNHC